MPTVITTTAATMAMTAPAPVRATGARSPSWMFTTRGPNCGAASSGSWIVLPQKAHVTTSSTALETSSGAVQPGHLISSATFSLARARYSGSRSSRKRVVCSVTLGGSTRSPVVGAALK